MESQELDHKTLAMIMTICSLLGEEMPTVELVELKWQRAWERIKEYTSEAQS